MSMHKGIVLTGLIIALAGCGVESKLNRNYKGKTQQELLIGMGRPTRVEELTAGRKVNIYQKSKILKAAPINTGQFQYDRFESPKATKTETYRFYIDSNGMVEGVKYEVGYER